MYEKSLSHPSDALSRPSELPAYDTGLSLVAWCAHCQTWHTHGRQEGHRAAHCFKPNSPYARIGYSIRCVGLAPPNILKDLSRRKPKGPDQGARS